MMEDIDDIDDRLRRLRERLAEAVLDLFYRVEELERNLESGGARSSNESFPMTRLLPLRTGAEIDAAMEVLKERVTALEESTEE
jgi:prefoldin subunit 5